VWADQLHDPMRGKISGQLGANAKPVKEGAWLTVFEDNSYPRPGMAESMFSKSADEFVLHRPLIIYYRYVEKFDPVELAGIGAVGGVGCWAASSWAGGCSGGGVERVPWATRYASSSRCGGADDGRVSFVQSEQRTRSIGV
jgi:hypothetical protein